VLADLTLIGIFLRGELLDIVVDVEGWRRGAAAEALEKGARRVGSGVGIGVGDAGGRRRKWIDWGMRGRVETKGK